MSRRVFDEPCAGACAQLIWKHSKGAVALRLRYLQQLEGAEPRTVLVRDIPGAWC